MKLSRALALAAALLPATSSSPPTSSGTSAHQHHRAIDDPSAIRHDLTRKVWEDFRLLMGDETCEEACIRQYREGLIRQIKGCVPRCRARRSVERGCTTEGDVSYCEGSMIRRSK